MPTSKAQNKAVEKYKRGHYDRFNVLSPKGTAERVKAHLAETGESANSFINRAIDETMERDKQQRKQNRDKAGE